MWTDEGYGKCTRCTDYRLLFSTKGRPWLCSVCTLTDAKAVRAHELLEAPVKALTTTVAERQKSRRLRFEAAGLCNICGKETPRAGKKTGEYCSKRYFVQAAYRARRAASGACMECPTGRHEPNSPRCADCRERNRRNATARYARNLGAGVCVDCSKRPAETGLVRCMHCASERKSKRSTTYSADYRKSRYERGMCANCKSPRLGDSHRCKSCGVASRNLGKMYQRRMRERKAA